VEAGATCKTKEESREKQLAEFGDHVGSFWANVEDVYSDRVPCNIAPPLQIFPPDRGFFCSTQAMMYLSVPCAAVPIKNRTPKGVR
jgi:hypothetical protein